RGQVADTRTWLVESERVHVCRPHQGGRLVEPAVADLAVTVAGADCGGYPRRPMLRTAILEDPGRVDAVGEALQCDAPSGEVRHHDRRDPGVVLDGLALRRARLGIQHLFEIRQRDLPLADLDDGATTHASTLRDGSIK